MTIAGVAPASEADDAAISADRRETKYSIEYEQRAALIAALDRHLPPHRFRGEGANRLPDPAHFVTTVYFDTPSLAHFNAACSDSENNVKLRAKEYYDLHPSLAELATSSDHVFHRAPWLWLELKRKAGDRTTKHRVRLERASIPTWICRAAAQEGGKLEDTDAEDAQAIRAYCRATPEPLSALCLVNYRRASWQSQDGLLRVTLDLDLGIFKAPQELWSRALVRSRLGQPLLRERRALLEIKRRTSTVPGWLEETLEVVSARSIVYSKFVHAARAVIEHG